MVRVGVARFGDPVATLGLRVPADRLGKELVDVEIPRAAVGVAVGRRGITRVGQPIT